MRFHLGAALVLHGMVLLLGHRWSPSAKAQEPALQLSEPQVEIPVEEVLPPKADVPDPVKEVRGAGGGEKSSERPHGTGAAPARSHYQAAVAGAPPTLLEAMKASTVDIPSADSTTKSDSSFDLGSKSGVASSESGSGDGGGGGKSGQKSGTAWTDSWDYVAGAKVGYKEDSTASAEETTLSQATIATVVSRSAGRVRACYQAGLRREPDLAGHIPVRFIVDIHGSVVVATDAGSTVADPTTIRCVLSIFSTMTFPARAQGVSLVATHLVVLPPG